MLENKNKYERALSELFDKYVYLKETLFLKDNPFKFSVGNAYKNFLVIDKKLTKDLSEELYVDNIADVEPIFVKQYETFDSEMKTKQWFCEDKLEIITR